MIYCNQPLALTRTENLSKDLPFGIWTVSGKCAENDSPAHQHTHFELIYLLRGRGVLRADLREIRLEQHRVDCVAPGQVHLFLPDADAAGFRIVFSESFPYAGDYDTDMGYPGRSLQLIRKAGAVVVREEVRMDIEDIMKKLQQEFTALLPFKLQVIKRYLRIMLIYLSRDLGDGMESSYTRDKELVQDFIQLVDKHFKELKMVVEYAHRLSITPNYLNEIVKKNTGYPAGHHIRQRVVLEAKRMGLYTRTNMKQIAYSLGFADCGHFSKFFKAAAGKNFSEFKRDAAITSI